MAEDPVPAVTEAEATGETAAIFADIRAVYRVGAVNLIWRHLATIPDALPWAWRAIRPVYVDGTIARAAMAFRANLRPPILPPVPPEVFGAIGLSSDDLARIQGVLRAYDRTNSMALIALTALQADIVASIPPPGPPPQGAEENLYRLYDLPALTPLNAMPPHVASLVARLNGFGAIGEQPILASMYRHLSHWPPYLGLAWAALAPLNRSGALHAAIAATLEHAQIAAAAVPMPRDPPPSGAIEAIALFIDDVLPKMVAICGMLHAMTIALDA
jgi:hypothetical protein